MACGIYRIYNKNNQKSYIGSSVDLNKREYKHFWSLRKNEHDNTYLQNSYNTQDKSQFIFEILEFCSPDQLIEKENFYINQYNSNLPNYGYNQAKVNEFRRNTYNQNVKIKLSKYNLEKNSNFKLFEMKNILNNTSKTFDNLVDAANYLIENSFTNGNPKQVRQKLSYCLRNKKVNNGKNNNGAIRKTCYKHKLKIIN